MGRVLRRRLIATTGVAVASCSLALAGGSAAALRHSSPRRARSLSHAAQLGSPTGLLNLAFADARAKGSFHQALTQIAGGVRGSLDDDVTLTSGRQAVVSSDGTRAEVEVIGKTVYMTGNQHALKSFFKFTGPEISVIGSNWVSIPSTSTAFASIAYDVTVPTALDEVAPSGHLSEGKRTTINGQQVIPISGGAPTAFAGGTDGRATIYVTATSDPLPVSASVQVTQSNHEKLVLTGTMGDWGEHVTVAPPTGHQLSDTQINVLVGELSKLAIRGQPGYFAVPAKDGLPTALGRPWGRSCRPVRLAVAPGVPSWIYTQVAAVGAEARKQGIDVTVEGRQLNWSHRSLYYRRGESPATTAQVQIVTTKSAGKATLPMQLSWNTATDSDKSNADLTSVTGTFSLPVLDGKAQTVRRSIRQLIAWTQGVSETTDPISGITLRSFTDRFTKSDIRAMLVMSGCAKPTGTTVTGIAA